MALARGFLSEEHEDAFVSARAGHNRGGAWRRVCGASTRGGGVCQQPPLSGHTRCLRHAGPKAAQALRLRQIAELAAGRLTPAEFERRELRRAANRTRETWKRDPWAPGRTIDLGDHEERFQVESGVAAAGVPIAPAVLDWLRWRYRRLQIDRQRGNEWVRVIHEEYPRRLRDAGPAPVHSDPRAATGIQPLWSASSPPVGSRRLGEDRPRPPAPTRNGNTMKPDRLDNIEVREDRLAEVAYQQRDVLAPLLALCFGAGEQRALIRALAIYLDRPTDLAAMRYWTTRAGEVRARAGVA